MGVVDDGIDGCRSWGNGAFDSHIFLMTTRLIPTAFIVLGMALVLSQVPTSSWPEPVQKMLAPSPPSPPPPPPRKAFPPWKWTFPPSPAPRFSSPTSSPLRLRSPPSSSRTPYVARSGAASRWPLLHSLSPATVEGVVERAGKEEGLEVSGWAGWDAPASLRIGLKTALERIPEVMDAFVTGRRGRKVDPSLLADAVEKGSWPGGCENDPVFALKVAGKGDVAGWADLGVNSLASYGHKSQVHVELVVEGVEDPSWSQLVVVQGGTHYVAVAGVQGYLLIPPEVAESLPAYPFLHPASPRTLLDAECAAVGSIECSVQAVFATLEERGGASPAAANRLVWVDSLKPGHSVFVPPGWGVLRYRGSSQSAHVGIIQAGVRSRVLEALLDAPVPWYTPGRKGSPAAALNARLYISYLVGHVLGGPGPAKDLLHKVHAQRYVALLEKDPLLALSGGISNPSLFHLVQDPELAALGNDYPALAARLEEMEAEQEVAFAAQMEIKGSPESVGSGGSGGGEEEQYRAEDGWEVMEEGESGLFFHFNPETGETVVMDPSETEQLLLTPTAEANTFAKPPRRYCVAMLSGMTRDACRRKWKNGGYCGALTPNSLEMVEDMKVAYTKAASQVRNVLTSGIEGGPFDLTLGAPEVRAFHAVVRPLLADFVEFLAFVAVDSDPKALRPFLHDLVYC